MAPFVAISKAPGVYIEEVQLPGPIPGVGTSTAAFIGPARRGPINKPTFLTNWTQFIEAFGVQDILGPYITAPTVYVTHAVRGFFYNGGATCYFVRVGTAVRASLQLNDRATQTPRPTLVVTAKQEGVTGNAITIAVKNANIVPSVAAARAEATLSAASNDQATVTIASAAANFRPSDIVFLEQGSTNERARIASVSGTTIKFQPNLTNAYTGGTMRIANLAPGQTKIRIANTTGIEPGTYIDITQGGITESRVVQSVESFNKFITLTQGLTNTYTMASGDAAVNLQTLEFTLIITTPGLGAENFPNLSMDPRHSRYFAKLVNSSNADVVLVDPPNPTAPPNNRPAELVATNMANRADDDITAIQSTHYHNAIDALKKVDDVNMLCTPDRTDQDIQQYMIDHCQNMQDRFAILDPIRRNASLSEIVTQLKGDGTSGNPGLASAAGFAALYYPWITTGNPVASGLITVPPSGHIAGLYARTDNNRGVHKAPANDTLRGALGVERVLSDDE